MFSLVYNKIILHLVKNIELLNYPFKIIHENKEIFDIMIFFFSNRWN